jgi:hypothetical protein
VQAVVKQPHRAREGGPLHYKRHRLDQTTLHRLGQQRAATLFAQAEAATAANPAQFVKDEFDAFLECDILANG